MDEEDGSPQGRAKLDLILQAARVLDSDKSEESSQASNEQSNEEEEHQTIAYYDSTDSEAESEETSGHKEGVYASSPSEEGTAELQETETLDQQTSELLSQPCGSGGHKRRPLESEAEMSAVKKARATATHNQKERERRRDLKQAVYGLRNQLRKKPRRLTTKAVLEAAQSEIRELKVHEHGQHTEIDSLTKKGNYLEWQLKKLLSDAEGRSRHSSRGPAPLYPPSTAAAAPTAAHPFLPVRPPPQIPSAPHQRGMDPRPSVPVINPQPNFAAALASMFPRPLLPQFPAVPITPPTITSPPSSFQAGPSSPSSGITHLSFLFPPPPHPPPPGGLAYHQRGGLVRPPHSLSATPPPYYRYFPQRSPYQPTFMFPGRYSPSSGPHQQPARAGQEPSVGFPTLASAPGALHSFFGYGPHGQLSMLPSLSQQSFGQVPTHISASQSDSSVTHSRPHSADISPASPRHSEISEHESIQAPEEEHHIAAGHPQLVMLRSGEPLTTTSQEAVSPNLARSELQSKESTFSEQEHSNGHTTPPALHLEATEPATDTAPSEPEEEEEEDIDVESSSDDESKGQLYANVTSSSAQASAYTEDQQPAGSEQGSDFLGQSSDGSESTSDSSMQQEMDDDNNGSSKNAELLQDKLNVVLETADADQSYNNDNQVSIVKEPSQNQRTTLPPSIPEPPSLIKINKSGVCSQHKNYTFTTSLTSSSSMLMTAHPLRNTTQSHTPSQLTNGETAHFSLANLPQPPALRSYQDVDKEAAMISKVIEQVRPHREHTAKMASKIVLEKINAFGLKKNGFKIHNGNCKQVDATPVHCRHQVWSLSNSDSDGESCDLTVTKRKPTIQRVRNGKTRKHKTATSIKHRFSKRRRPTTHFHAVA